MIINGQYSIIAANNAISDIFVGKTSGLLGYWDENVDKGRENVTVRHDVT